MKQWRMHPSDTESEETAEIAQSNMAITERGKPSPSSDKVFKEKENSPLWSYLCFYTRHQPLVAPVTLEEL